MKIKVKKILHFNLLFIIILLSFSKNTLASESWLLDGQSLNIGPDHLTVTTTSKNATDNNPATYFTVGVNPSTTDNIWYEFPNKVDISAFKFHTNGTIPQYRIHFLDENDQNIIPYVVPSYIDGRTQTVSVKGVKKILTGNLSSSLTANYYELNFYGVNSPIENTSTITTEVTDGGFQLNTPQNIEFGSIILNGNYQTLSKSLGVIEAGDLTGRGKGWRMQIQSTQLKSNTDILPPNSIILNAPVSITALNGTESPPPVMISGYPWFIDVGSDVTIISSNVNEGMGIYSLDFNNNNALSITIPPSAKIGNYSSTITWKIVVGP